MSGIRAKELDDTYLNSQSRLSYTSITKNSYSPAIHVCWQQV